MSNDGVEQHRKRDALDVPTVSRNAPFDDRDRAARDRGRSPSGWTCAVHRDIDRDRLRALPRAGVIASVRTDLRVPHRMSVDVPEGERTSDERKHQYKAHDWMAEKRSASGGAQKQAHRSYFYIHGWVPDTATVGSSYVLVATLSRRVWPCGLNGISSTMPVTTSKVSIPFGPSLVLVPRCLM